MKRIALITLVVSLFTLTSTAQNNSTQFNVSETQSGVVRIDVQLDAKVDSEMYRVEKSDDMRNWKTIKGEILIGPRGTSNRFYMIDKSTKSNVCFYRLVKVEEDKSRTEIAWMPLGGQVEYAEL